jgi:integrase
LQAAQRVFPVAPSVITRAVREARRIAKLPEHIKFHTMRHEATSTLMERDLNPVEVANMTGHASLDTMRRYTHPQRSAVLKKLG